MPTYTNNAATDVVEYLLAALDEVDGYLSPYEGEEDVYFEIRQVISLAVASARHHYHHKGEIMTNTKTQAIIAAEAAQRERDAQLIEADAKLCDCSARSEGECACGAWCESKTITSARAAEIIRKQST